MLYGHEALVEVDQPQLAYVFLELETPVDKYQLPNPPLNLCLAVDRSTSMRGERLETVKAAAHHIARQLRPQDLLSIVMFSDRAEVLLPATRRPDLVELQSRLRMLQAEGGTEILHGLKAGFQEILRNFSRTRTNHLVLLTDGRTYGDEDACLKLAESAAARGVGFTAMGVGGEWNDAFLDNLAMITGGVSLFVHQPEEIHGYLQQIFAALALIYAEQVVLEFECAGGVALRSAFRLHPEALPLPETARLRLGHLRRGAPLRVLLEFLVEPGAQKGGQRLLAAGRFLLQLAQQGESAPSIPFQITLPLIPESSDTPPPTAIFQALASIALYRLQERARQEAAAGDPHTASLDLQRIATHLISWEKKELAQTALDEAFHLRNSKTFSNTGEKLIKYGTRGLVDGEGPALHPTVGKASRRCPDCQHEEYLGALFCSQCGSMLAPGELSEAASTRYDKPSAAFRLTKFAPGDLSQAYIELYLVEADQSISLYGRADTTLGRADPDQSILPDIDLSPFRAFETGVSRLHASIHITGEHASVIDLGSANGTRLNGKRLPPHTLTPIHDGDVLALGKLILQVLVK
jgi:Ca-activated chloride channel family protein